MKTIRQLLRDKGHKVWSIAPEETVLKAVQRMAEREVGALLVTEQGRVVGVVSERDYARKIVLKDRLSHETQVREVMTTRLVYAWMEQTVEDCLSKMTELKIRHMPVVDGGRLVGIISIGDLVKSIIDEQQYTINQLERYICG